MNYEDPMKIINPAHTSAKSAKNSKSIHIRVYSTASLEQWQSPQDQQARENTNISTGRPTLARAEDYKNSRSCHVLTCKVSISQHFSIGFSILIKPFLSFIFCSFISTAQFSKCWLIQAFSKLEIKSILSKLRSIKKPKQIPMHENCIAY